METDMSAKYPHRMILRAPLITAGHKRNLIDKAMASDADAIVLDIEDGVPPDLKAEARRVIAELLNEDICKKRLIYVRLNALDTGMTLEDIEAVAHPNLDGFLYAKVYSPGDVQVIDKMIAAQEKKLGLPTDYFDALPILETPQSILQAFEIATAARRVRGLQFGAEDLLGDMEGHHTIDSRSIQHARSQTLLAARAAGIMPIDSPYIFVNQHEDHRRYMLPAYELGFEGMLAISPSQIATIKEMYAMRQDKVDEAYEMVRIAGENEQAKQGVAIAGKHFISPPTLKKAQNLIARYEATQAFEAFLKKNREE
jgi:citrate lyase subunit beta/citryl-CoA lyase